MTETPVRVRFAPSPTGRPHVGNIRTAMFNWLLARHTGGKFILRIEDTDVARKVEGAVEAIMDGLKWLGLDWDEGPGAGGDCGPYFQSERLPLYKEACDRLVAQGDAYRCYCSTERLEAMRKDQEAKHLPPGYDRRCRNLTPDEQQAAAASGITPVIRFQVPLSGRLGFHDEIYGDVEFDLSTIDDFVMLKSDGYPTYHLASVVDDHAMKITHVIRAEEWISSTPRQLMIYQALGYTPPAYIHHPMILGPDRAKLSKRHGAVSILEYRDQGYLPETMFNFLALIGWSLDDKTEIMPRRQLIDGFDLARIGKTGAIFNREKLDWMNGAYIRSLTLDDFTSRALPFLEKGLPAEVKRPLDMGFVKRVLALIQERARTLVEVAELSGFFFLDRLEYDPALLVGDKMTPEMSKKALTESRARIVKVSEFNHDGLEAVLRPLAAELGLKAGQLFGTLRIATTGRTAAPPLFQTMEVLGKDVTLARIDAALARL